MSRTIYDDFELIPLENNKANHKLLWKAAEQWEEKANKGKDEQDTPIKWRWDCNFKLDFDGELLSISSRFYPPHKQHDKTILWDGTISLMFGGEKVKEIKLKADTLEEIRALAEDGATKLISEVSQILKSSFDNTNRNTR